MKFLAIIPARYASSRFPGKPLSDICGKPMIQHVCEKMSSILEHVYVATDHERIYKAVEGFGGRAVMTSPEHRSGTDRCREALNVIEIELGIYFDVVINVQGDEPFVALEQITSLQKCFESESTQIATLIKPFSAAEDIFSSNTPKVVVSKDGNALYFSRSVVPHLRGVEPSEWQSKHQYFKHIGIYAYRAPVLRHITALEQGILEQAESLEQLRWLENGYTIKTAVTNHESLAVDTPEDLEKVVKYLSDK